MSKKLFVEVHYTVKAGKREEFLLKIKEAGIETASREESGNGRYEYFYPVEQENQVVLFEIWDTAEAQKKHAQTAHYQLLSGLKAEYVLDTQIKKATLEEESV